MKNLLIMGILVFCVLIGGSPGFANVSNGGLIENSVIDYEVEQRDANYYYIEWGLNKFKNKAEDKIQNFRIEIEGEGALVSLATQVLLNSDDKVEFENQNNVPGKKIVVRSALKNFHEGVIVKMFNQIEKENLVGKLKVNFYNENVFLGFLEIDWNENFKSLNKNGEVYGSISKVHKFKNGQSQLNLEFRNKVEILNKLAKIESIYRQRLMEGKVAPETYSRFNSIWVKAVRDFKYEEKNIVRLKREISRLANNFKDEKIHGDILNAALNRAFLR